MADPLGVIVGDIQTASQLRVAFTLLRDVDPAVLKAARDRIGTAEAVGPFTDPTAWLHGPHAENARRYRQLLKSVEAVCELLRSVEPPGRAELWGRGGLPPGAKRGEGGASDG